ncbi:MAG: chaperone NapD [Acidobacteriota bacterium]|jgi:nitrate reductase NapAB chaperone NapD
MPNTDWSVAGLCVTTRPGDLDEVGALLSARPDLEVHARDGEGCRLIVVQERATIRDHRRGLEEIQALPGVLTAELVVHYNNPEVIDREQENGGTR